MNSQAPTPVSTVFGKSVFDVGANLGNKTAEYLGSGVEKVVCFEPQLDLVGGLLERFGDNLKVTVLPYALGPVESEMKLYPSNANTIATMSEKFQTGRFKAQGYVWYEPVTVPVKTAQQMILKYGTPDYMKIDVEGFEYQVVSGLSHEPSQLPKVISYEYSEEFPEEYTKVAQELVARGYSKFTVSFGESGVFTPVTTVNDWGSLAELLEYLSTVHRGAFSWGDIYAAI